MFDEGKGGEGSHFWVYYVYKLITSFCLFILFHIMLLFFTLETVDENHICNDY